MGAAASSVSDTETSRRYRKQSAPPVWNVTQFSVLVENCKEIGKLQVP